MNGDPVLAARDLIVRRDGFVLDIPAFDIGRSEVVAVIGPNGCGKTTLLETLALLRRPDGGELRFGGEVIGKNSNLLSYRRRMAVVFQEPLLLDTSVFGNVAAGLRLRGVGRREARARVERWLERLGIAHLADRQAWALSGGEAQRASLARAFVLEPEVLLLDEPFAALDAPSRAGLLADVQRLLAETGVATALVTHDRNEAMMLGQRVAVLLDGHLAQMGSPVEVFSRPATEEIAAFVGVENILTGVVRRQDAGLAAIAIGVATIEVATEMAVGQRALVLLRPEDITLYRIEVGAPPSSARNRLGGQVRVIRPVGGLVRVEVDCGLPVVALITQQSLAEMGLEPGAPVIAVFKATAAHTLPRA